MSKPYWDTKSCSALRLKGVLAQTRRAVMPEFRVVLVEPCFEESIGFVARAMKNFAITALHIVNPVAKLGAGARSRGGHAQEILDSIILHRSLQEAIAEVNLSVGTTAQRAHSSTNLLRTPATLREFAGLVKSKHGRIALVFGREGTGLNNHELGLCDMTLTIPSAETYPTLNLSHAAAIVFYELFGEGVPRPTEELASDQVRQTVVDYFSESLTRVGLEEYKIGLASHSLRTVMARSAMRRREGSVLAGAMRHIAEALSESSNGQRRENEVGPLGLG